MPDNKDKNGGIASQYLTITASEWVMFWSYESRFMKDNEDKNVHSHNIWYLLLYTWL